MPYIPKVLKRIHTLIDGVDAPQRPDLDILLSRTAWITENSAFRLDVVANNRILQSTWIFSGDFHKNPFYICATIQIEKVISFLLLPILSLLSPNRRGKNACHTRNSGKWSGAIFPFY